MKQELRGQWTLTVNLDLVVLQRLSSLIGGQAGIPPSILHFCIEDLQCSPTCGSRGDEQMATITLIHSLIFSVTPSDKPGRTRTL